MRGYDDSQAGMNAAVAVAVADVAGGIAAKNDDQIVEIVRNKAIVVEVRATISFAEQLHIAAAAAAAAADRAAMKIWTIAARQWYYGYEK